jgi:uncharacterized membrane protein
VTAEVAPLKLLATESASVSVSVTVGEAAPAGDYKVKLIGKAPRGGESSQETTVTVPKKE